MKVCKWIEDQDGNWEMGCGRIFSLNEGTPLENEMFYCPHCGDKIREVLYRSNKFEIERKKKGD